MWSFRNFTFTRYHGLLQIIWLRIVLSQILSSRLACSYFVSHKNIKGKDKLFPLQVRLWPRGWVELWLYSSIPTALEWGEWSAARPGRTLPPEKTRYPLYRRLSGPQGRSGRAENLAAPEFDPRTVQPVVSRYTDWATCLIKIWIVVIITHTHFI